MDNLQLQRTEKIKQLLSELNGCLKMSVNKAIEIGKELHEQKEGLEHGRFLIWVETELSLSRQTVDRYIKVFLNKDKMSKLDSLQEAYIQIESIEKQERRKQETEDNHILNQRIKTGQKPEGWDRRHDRLYKQRIDENTFQERKDKILSEQPEYKKTNPEEINNIINDLNNLNNTIGKQIEHEKSKEETRKKLRITTNNELVNQEVRFESERHYALTTYPEPNRRLEYISNFIKFFKGMANECHLEIQALQKAVNK
jgi:hypothetical protein